MSLAPGLHGWEPTVAHLGGAPQSAAATALGCELPAWHRSLQISRSLEQNKARSPDTLPHHCDAPQPLPSSLFQGASKIRPTTAERHATTPKRQGGEAGVS